MVLGIMNNRNLIGSLFMLLGGILSILPVLPLPSEIFPIFSFFLGRDAGNSNILYFSFWGENRKFNYKNISYPLPGPSGWTPLSISPSLLIFFYFTIGIIAIIYSLILLTNFFPSNKFKIIRKTNLPGNLVGIGNLVLDLLIFYGTPSDSTAGLQPIHPAFGAGLYSFSMSIGLGYWLLVLSGLLILSGSIINTKFLDKFLLKGKKKTLIENDEYKQKNEVQNVGKVNYSASSQIDHFLGEIEEIIGETTDSEEFHLFKIFYYRYYIRID